MQKIGRAKILNIRWDPYIGAKSMLAAPVGSKFVAIDEKK